MSFLKVMLCMEDMLIMFYKQQISRSWLERTADHGPDAYFLSPY